jgi:hypothetical protein
LQSKNEIKILNQNDKELMESSLGVGEDVERRTDFKLSPVWYNNPARSTMSA